MFVAFNIKIESFADYFKVGNQIYDENNKQIRSKLKNLVIQGGSFDGSKIEAEWFPQTNADVFISHSHRDKNLAISFAGFLKSYFDLNVFIDSSVWGYSDDLLKEIDEKCFQRASNTYNYACRNATTSHIHMMLATALDKLIDNSECLIFLNTHNSISPYEVINKTASPWLYHELAISKIIRRKNLRTVRNSQSKTFSDSTAKLNESILQFQVLYDAPLTHLINLTEKDLCDWIRKFSPSEFALDTLYEIKIQELSSPLLD